MNYNWPWPGARGSRCSPPAQARPWRTSIRGMIRDYGTLPHIPRGHGRHERTQTGANTTRTTPRPWTGAVVITTWRTSGVDVWCRDTTAQGGFSLWCVVCSNTRNSGILCFKYCHCFVTVFWSNPLPGKLRFTGGLGGARGRLGGVGLSPGN